MNRIVFNLQIFAKITNYNDDTLVSGTADGDFIISGGYNSTVRKHVSPSNVTIDAGEGDDTITSYGSQVTINAGAGNDTITSIRNCHRKKRKNRKKLKLQISKKI